MIEVTIREGQFEKGMRIFKKVCQKDGFMMELRERRYFVSASARKRAKRKAKKKSNSS